MTECSINQKGTELPDNTQTLLEVEQHLSRYKVVEKPITLASPCHSPWLYPFPSSSRAEENKAFTLLVLCFEREGVRAPFIVIESDLDEYNGDASLILWNILKWSRSP